MKFLIQLVGSVCIGLFVIIDQLHLLPSNLTQRLEWIAYDQRIEANLVTQADDNIAIIDIDEYSLQQIGQWPWTRVRVAELISSLFEDYNIQLAGLDIVFAESQKDSSYEFLAKEHPHIIEELKLANPDDVLANTLGTYPVVTAHYFDRNSELPSTGLLPNPIELISLPKFDLPLPVAKRYTSNIAKLNQQAISGGFFDNPLTDSDGTFRRAAMLQMWQGDIYPSLSLAMFQQLLGFMPVQLDEYSTGLEGIDVGGFYIPTDPHGGALVPFYGPRNTFSYFSATDILDKNIDTAKLQGKIVFIGTSAPGLMDLRSTPVGPVYPGVEIHATLLAAMLAQDFKQQPAYATAGTAILLLLLTIIMTIFFPYLKGISITFFGVMLLALHVSFNLWLWNQGYVLPIASGILLIVALTLYHATFNLWKENKVKKQVADTFGRYIPPKLVDDIVRNPAAQDLNGREESLTVLFSDVRGFTSFAEKIPAEQLTNMMNKLLTPVTEAIYTHRGTIDKYMGDAVMAFWGAPLDDKLQATNAVQAALRMHQAIAEFNLENNQDLAMGIGIHTGIMSVGNMGSDYRVAYTVLGDNVNLASRIEGLTKFYKTNLLISSDTLQKLIIETEYSKPTSNEPIAIRDSNFEEPKMGINQLIESANYINDRSDISYLVRLVDLSIVKGKKVPVALFEVIKKPEKAELIKCEIARAQSSNYAITEYQKGNFTKCIAICSEHMKQFPEDKLAFMYSERCQALIKKPPSQSWSGIYKHDQK